MGEMHVTYPGRDGSLTSATLRPGAVDDAARQFYARAACAPLAAALHQLTGWPFLIICAATGRPDGWHEAVHAAVISGQVVLDIGGITALPDALGAWRNDHGPAIPVVTWSLEEGGFGYPEPSEDLMAVTQVFAERLVSGLPEEDGND